jgi:hypothetical protein
MPALGQKQTCAVHPRMSAFTPKEDIACGKQGSIETARQSQSRRDPTGEDGYN